MINKKSPLLKGAFLFSGLAVNLIPNAKPSGAALLSPCLRALLFFYSMTKPAKSLPIRVAKSEQ